MILLALLMIKFYMLANIFLVYHVKWFQSNEVLQNVTTIRTIAGLIGSNFLLNFLFLLKKNTFSI